MGSLKGVRKKTAAGKNVKQKAMAAEGTSVWLPNQLSNPVQPQPHPPSSYHPFPYISTAISANPTAKFASPPSHPVIIPKTTSQNPSQTPKKAAPNVWCCQTVFFRYADSPAGTGTAGIGNSGTGSPMRLTSPSRRAIRYRISSSSRCWLIPGSELPPKIR